MNIFREKEIGKKERGKEGIERKGRGKEYIEERRLRAREGRYGRKREKKVIYLGREEEERNREGR